MALGSLDSARCRSLVSLDSSPEIQVSSFTVQCCISAGVHILGTARGGLREEAERRYGRARNRSGARKRELWKSQRYPLCHSYLSELPDISMRQTFSTSVPTSRFGGLSTWKRLTLLLVLHEPAYESRRWVSGGTAILLSKQNCPAPQRGDRAWLAL